MNTDYALIREIEIDDYSRGFLDLLHQNGKLTDYDTFKKNYDIIKDKTDNKIFVLYDYKNNLVIGYCHIIILHNFDKYPTALIDSIVVYSTYKQDTRKLLLNKLISYATDQNCSHIIMHTSSSVSSFYVKNNFTPTNIGLTYFIK